LLGLAFGELFVEERILRGMSAKQFQAWEYFYEIQPFGPFREDYRAALVTSMVHNAAVAGEHQKPVSHFLPPWSQPTEEEKVLAKQRELEQAPLWNGIRVTSEVWFAMCMSAMHTAEEKARQEGTLVGQPEAVQ
jgi:uncharacterized protein DUF4035